MADRAASRGRAVAAAGLIALFVHLPSLGGGFVHDDRPQIATNPLVAGLGSLPTLWSTGVWAGAGSGSSFYRPMMTTSFAMDAALFGRAPLPMHAVQLLLFAVLVATATAVVASLAGDVRVGLGAGLLLAVHPVNVEAAAWISARCEILAALFALLCLAARARRLGARAPSAAAAVAEGLALFLALASKESAVAVLAPLLALDRARGASFALPTVAARFAPAAVAVGVYAVLRARALGSLSGGLLGGSEPAALLGALGQGALRLVAPISLSITPPVPGAADVVAGVLLALGGGALLLRLWRHPSPALVLATLGLAFLAVGATGAARIGEMADRYLLLPSLAAGWLVTLFLEGLPLRVRRPARLGAAFVGLLLAALSFRHGTVYASDLALWSHAARANPASGRAALNLANALLEAGDLPGARAWLDRAAAIDPEDRLLRMNRAVLSAESGDAAGARAILERLVADDPAYWPAQLRLGHLELEAGRDDAAALRYEATLRVHGLSAEAFAGLGVARERQGRRADARAALSRALALDPGVQNADALRALLRRLESGGPS